MKVLRGEFAGGLLLQDAAELWRDSIPCQLKAARACSGKVGTGFPSRQTPRAFARRSCSNKKIERDDDSKKSHHALKEPDSAASLIRGHKAWRRHPLYGHLNTVFGGKRGGAEREKT